MNLIFRMLWVWWKTRGMPDIEPENMVSTMKMMVLPNDLDVNLHMTNGRYLTICDLSRIDMFIRSGLARAMIKNNWIPIIADHTMTYKRPLDAFQKFDLEMEIKSWDEKYFHCTHRFVRNGRVMAEGTSKGVIKARKGGVIPPQQVVDHLIEQRDLKEAAKAA